MLFNIVSPFPFPRRMKNPRIFLGEVARKWWDAFLTSPVTISHFFQQRFNYRFRKIENLVGFVVRDSRPQVVVELFYDSSVDIYALLIYVLLRARRRYLCLGNFSGDSGGVAQYYGSDFALRTYMSARA